MPILITTLDRIAETWLGATGWAIGSQTCSGIIPDFAPKPKSASINTEFREAGESNAAPARMEANEDVRSAPERSRNIAISAANPAWVIARYQTPARTVPD